MSKKEFKENDTVWVWSVRKDAHAEVFPSIVRGTVKQAIQLPDGSIYYIVLPDGVEDDGYSATACMESHVCDSEPVAYKALLENMNNDILDTSGELRFKTKEFLNLQLAQSKVYQHFLRLKRKEIPWGSPIP